MNKTELYNLWVRVLRHDKDAKEEFVKYYIKIYPDYSKILIGDLSDEKLEMMYQQLSLDPFIESRKEWSNEGFRGYK